MATSLATDTPVADLMSWVVSELLAVHESSGVWDFSLQSVMLFAHVEQK